AQPWRGLWRDTRAEGSRSARLPHGRVISVTSLPSLRHGTSRRLPVPGVSEAATPSRGRLRDARARSSPIPPNPPRRWAENQTRRQVFGPSTRGRQPGPAPPRVQSEGFVFSTLGHAPIG